MDILSSGILNGKPASVISVTSPATYMQIIDAIQSGKVQHETLKTIESMCKMHPHDVLCILYKSYEEDVLLIHGFPLQCTPITGSNLKDIFQQKCKDDCIYVFTYVRD